MATVYKVHPAIGIARVGNHATSFFIGPELGYASELQGASLLKGTLPVELDGNGTDAAFTTFKRDGQIRRQGARFRVFAYDQAPDGSLSNPREVTPGPNIEITWTVELCNRKAAWERRIGMPGRRNVDIADRTKLIVGPVKRSVSGPLKTSEAFIAQFFGHSDAPRDVNLGILKTDSAGRLVVLGGFGRAFNDGTNADLLSGNFGNRDGWTDDISDGAVTAEAEIDGQRQNARGARVIIGPPDFAPDIGQPVTLYDTARQVAASFGVPDPTQPSFARDVLPILARCAKLRWTNGLSLWGKIAKTLNEDWQGLSNNTDPVTAGLRRQLAEVLSQPLPLLYSEGDDDVPLELTAIQKAILRLWAAGSFVRDWNNPPQPSIANPDDLDRGPLEYAVGGGFFPGIEAGDRMADATNYTEPFRLKENLPAGFFTEQMAVPWHSDFLACNTNWWPSQRPDLAPQRNNPDGFFPQWTAGLVSSVAHMIANYSRLGYIKPMTVAGKNIQAEDERVPPRS